jgi:hypothetical protein
VDYKLLLGDEELELLIAEKARRFEKLVSGGNVLYPAAVPCVRRLGAAWPLGIASGALRTEIQLMLRGADLLDAFAFIVSAGDTEATKPLPDPYLRGEPRRAARHLRHQSRIPTGACGPPGRLACGPSPSPTPTRVSPPRGDTVVDSLDEITCNSCRRWSIVVSRSR